MNIQYTKTNNGGSKITFDITLQYDLFENAKVSALEKKAKHLKLDGFREGKVPLSIIESQYGREIVMEALQIIIDEAYRYVLTEEKILPITEPEIKFDDDIQKSIQDKKQLKILIAYGYAPYIKLPDMKNVQVSASQNAEDVSDSEVEQYIQQNKLTDVSPDEVKSRLTLAKVRESEERFNSELLQEVLQASEYEALDYPVSLEVNHQRIHFDEKLNDLGLTKEQYLESQKLTFEELEAQWEKEVRDYLPVMILLSQIVREENLDIPNFDQIEGIDERTRLYYQNVAMQQAGLKWLKDQWLEQNPEAAKTDKKEKSSKN
ncbi:hypothetical protein IPJ91_02855 [bacterium]|nr:MAG: hypothetical protein IPJ91_02855 [bacterium]